MQPEQSPDTPDSSSESSSSTSTASSSGSASTSQPESASPKPSRRKLWLFLILAILLVAAAFWWFAMRPTKEPATSPKPSPQASANEATDTATPMVDTTVLLSGQKHIWEIAFLPTGDILFTERGGTISIFRNGQASEVGSVADVYATGEGGLMGLAIDPDFNKNRAIYTCYNSTAGDIRIVRWRVGNDFKTLQNEKAIVTGMPGNTATFPGRHSGCRLAWGPDGYLWVGTGDVAKGDTAIQPKSLGGKVLRIDRDGKAASGNIGGEFDGRIFSYGHRNVQGLAFFPAPKNGVLGLSAEHGPRTDDEVNELKKGNFGWAPPADGYNENVPMTDLERFPEAIPSIWSSGTPTLAPAGAAILHGTKWKGWHGALAVAMLKTEHVKILRLNDKNQVTQEEKLLDGDFGRLRAVVQGPDGNLYVGSSEGDDDKIIKITPREN